MNPSPLKDTEARDFEIARFGRPRADVDSEISAAGGPKAYASAMLLALDGYLQICADSPRGPDARYLRLALNGVKCAIIEQLISLPPSLVSPNGPVASVAKAADALYYPDEGDGLRLPVRAVTGAYGPDAVHAAVTLLSDAQERVDAVGPNTYLRRTLSLARELLGATVELNGRPVPRTAAEYGETMLCQAADALKGAARMAAYAPCEATADQVVTAKHLVMQARNALGCGLIDSPDALAALKGIQDVAWSAPANIDAGSLRMLGAMAQEYGRAARGETPWFEPQISDGSGQRFLPVVFVGESCWQLCRREDVKSSAQSESYEGAWKLIDALRTLSTRDFDGYDHLQWVQISGPGSTEDSEPRTWRELTQAAHVTPQNAPAVRAAAMG